MFVGSVGVGVGGRAFGGDIPNGIVVVVQAVRSADGIQAVEFVVGVVQGFTARGIHHLADVAIRLVGKRKIQARAGGGCSTGLQCAAAVHHQKGNG